MSLNAFLTIAGFAIDTLLAIGDDDETILDFFDTSAVDAFIAELEK